MQDTELHWTASAIGNCGMVFGQAADVLVWVLDEGDIDEDSRDRLRRTVQRLKEWHALTAGVVDEMSGKSPMVGLLTDDEGGDA